MSMISDTSRALLAFLMVVLLIPVSSVMFSVAFAQEPSVKAELSASTVTRDESVMLTVTAVGVDAELDASSLGADFDVVNSSSSRQVMSVTGADNRLVNTSVVQWTLELYPKGIGVFTVPSVKVGDLETQLLSLTVNDVSQGAQRDIFLEANVDTTSPWVQSQVVMTLKVFQAIEIVDGGLDAPVGDNLMVERIGEDKRSREVRDGREYSVTERRFAVFPQKSGTATIEPVVLSVSVPADPNRVRGFFSPTRKLTRRSDPITLEVQVRPPSGSAWWLPARELILQSQWQGDPASAEVDQPLTRTLIMRAEGVMDTQLPRINVPAIDGLSLYAEEPVLGMGANDDSLVAEQRINWALIPQRSGTLTLPEISIEWFNTRTGEVEVTQLPAETIEVSPASSSSSTAGINQSSSNSQAGALSESAAPDALQDEIALNEGTQSSDSLIQPSAISDNTQFDLGSSVGKWRIAAMSMLVLWLLTALAWWYQRKGSMAAPAGTGSIKASANGAIDALRGKLAPMSDIEKSCQQGHLPDIKRSLLDWARHQWPDKTPATLDALQARLPAGTASDKLSMLQSALYSNPGSEKFNAELGEELKTLASDIKSAIQEKIEQEAPDSRKKAGLPGL